MIKNIYNFILTIPDRLYIFPSIINGKKEYFLSSYNYTKNICDKASETTYCIKILVWREFFHLLGSLFFILIAHYANKIFQSTVVGLVILIAVVGWITFQEFYLHPTFYGQHVTKGIIDWLVWVTPIGVYMFCK